MPLGYVGAVKDCRTLLRSMFDDRSGSTVVVFAVAAPVLLLAVLGVVGLSTIQKDRARLQDELDALTLDAARAFVDYSDSSKKIVKAEVDQRVRDKTQLIKNLNAVYAPLTISAEIDYKDMTVKSTLSGPLAIHPFKFLRKEQVDLKLTSAAIANVDSKPICILALEDDSETALEFAGDGQVVAKDCVIWGNSDGPQSLKFQGGGTVLSERLCTVGRAGSPGRYKVRPQAEEGCKTVRDPMMRWKPPVEEPCIQLPGALPDTLVDYDGSQLVDTPLVPLAPLLPGNYCNGLNVKARNVVFRPGIYTIKGPLIINGEADVRGTDVGFYLSGDKAKVNIDGKGKVTLIAAKTGVMAGVIMAMDRKSPRANSSIMGQVDLKIGGIMYLPTQDVTYWGETDTRAASPLTTLIALTLKIGGDAYLEVKNDKDEATYAPVVETGQGSVRLM